MVLWRMEGKKADQYRGKWGLEIPVPDRLPCRLGTALKTPWLHDSCFMVLQGSWI